MQNSKNGAVESVLSCDPLLQQLISAYSERNATAIESALGRVHEDVCSGSIRQGELGTADCVHVIFSILNELLGKPYALTRVESKRKVLDYTSLTAIHFDPGNTENQHESLIERCLWVLVRICRREMSKMSANDTNMELLESHQKSFEIITDICAQYVRSSRVVLPVCWLIMVLASDSSERQFRLASANATSLVVKIMAEHRSDVNIAEMACRAARNLAAGDSDVVAKFVEDRICEGLVCIIRAQIRHPKAAVKNDGNNHEAIISRKKVSNSESCPVTPVGTGISDSSMQPIIERPVNETVCEAALWAIVNLSCEENVSTILGSVGCIDAIVDVAITCRSAEVAMAAVSAIRNVSSVGTLNFSLLARTKVCEILLSNLKTYSSSIELVEVGLWALTNLACDCVLADRLGSLGAAKVVADLYYRCASAVQ